MFVPAEDFVVSYGASDLETCERATHVMKRSANDVRKLQVSGFYVDVDLPAPTPDIDEVERKYNELTGDSSSYDLDSRHTILEVQVNLDLSGFEDTNKGEPTGIQLPYIVTVAEDSGEILSVYRNYDENDTFKRKKPYFVHYPFTPGLGFYGNGLIHLLGNLSRTATANLRQLIDAGTLSNMPAGFKARGLRIRDDDQPLQPGEWRDVDVVGAELRGSLMPLPYKEPSQTLFQLLGFVVNAAQKFVGTTDIGTGNVQNTEMPVGTTVALMERGSRIMSAVHKRLYNGLKQEFKLLSALFALDPTDYPYNITGNEAGLKAKDFDGRIDIIPVANPNIFSMSQRVTLAQEQLKLAQANPQMHNQYETLRRMYTALGVDNIEQILPPPQQAMPMPPVKENGMLQLAVIGKQQLKAFPEQNHDAHIATHLSYMTSMIVKANPAALQILQTHIFEHISLKAMSVIQQELQEAGEQAQQVPPELVQSRMAEIESELISDYLQKENQVLGMQNKVPLVDLKEKEVQLREQEQMQSAQQDQMELQFDKQRAAEQAAIQRERINSTEDIAQMRARIALERTRGRG